MRLFQVGQWIGSGEQRFDTASTNMIEHGFKVMRCSEAHAYHFEACFQQKDFVAFIFRQTVRQNCAR